MKKLYIALTLTVASVLLFSCNNNNSGKTKSDAPRVERNSAADSGVKIGDQIWSSFNLEVTKFRNGDEILYAKSVAEWTKAVADKKAAWCYYNDDPAMGDKYGKLYNWYAVNDARGLAPEGWHIPSNKECEDLMFALGGKETAAKKMKSKEGWSPDKENDNSSGFNALPAGTRDIDGVSNGVEYNTSWWTSYEEDERDASCFSVFFDSDEALIYVKGSKGDGYAVRCVKDAK